MPRLGTTNQIEQLDDFTLLTVFNMMKLEGVLRFADRSTRFHDLITKYDIITKFQPNSKWLIIESNQTTRENILIKTSEIIVNDFETIQMALKTMGSYIHRIQFNCLNFTQEQVIAISHTINKHTSSTLNEIILRNPNKNMTRDWENEFSGVHSIGLELKNGGSISQLHESFPNVEKIELTVGYRSNVKFLMHPMLKLKHLLFIDGPSQAIEEHPTDVLQHNPQLLTFHFNEIDDPRFIDSVNKILPDLKSLALSVDDFGGKYESPALNLHFANVTEFFLSIREMSACVSPGSQIFSFDRLERFRLEVDQFPLHWRNFMEKNKSLRWVSLPWSPLTPTDLHQIYTSLPDLEEIIINWSEANHHDGFREIFFNNSKLKRLGIVLNGQIDRISLLGSLSPKWRLIKESSIGKKMNPYYKEMHAILSFEWAE